MYIFKRQFHSDAYYVALMLMAASLPLSRFAMSFMQFTLLGLWLWSGFSFETTLQYFKEKSFLGAFGHFIKYIVQLSYRNVITKFSLFFRNKAALVLVSLFLLHVVGLIHTTDFQYAFKDLRTKLPLLAFPIILSTMEPLTNKRFNRIMLIHAFAVIAGTLFGLNELLKGEFTDIRNISVFISPIRFSLNICIAIFTLVYFIYKRGLFPLSIRFLYVLIIIWLILFLVILESGIGLIILLTISMILLLYLVFSQKEVLTRIIVSTFLIAIPAFFFIYIGGIVREYNNVEKVDIETLDKYTQQGNKYIHDTVYLGIEDGKYVGLYLSLKELEQGWNQRSSYDFNGLDDNSQDIKFTIIRFLTSKGYRKDLTGINQLTDEEVGYIERGIANINYVKSPRLKTRVSKIMLGYYNFKYDDDPNGSSVLQRIEFWKASIGLIKKYFLVGVGTGDLKEAFRAYYDQTDSPLSIANRWRSHNQYLSMFVGFGIIGFLWFVFTLLYPPLKARKFLDYFYAVFFITMILSMLTEDTIETQAGVTLFAFFNAFLLFVRKAE